MPTAYSYVRFSTPEQSKGGSVRRQLELSEKYAEQNNLTRDETLQHLTSAFQHSKETTLLQEN